MTSLFRLEFPFTTVYPSLGNLDLLPHEEMLAGQRSRSRAERKKRRRRKKEGRRKNKEERKEEDEGKERFSINLSIFLIDCINNIASYFSEFNFTDRKFKLINLFSQITTPNWRVLQLQLEARARQISCCEKSPTCGTLGYLRKQSTHSEKVNRIFHLSKLVPLADVSLKKHYIGLL